mmetsp:Transcript_3297/g.10166  ORF Transcript_3297/g.10166 Transcript_3297/m.10166 type:complete len:249 (+) Transcript_3297:266-1012(+)
MQPMMAMVTPGRWPVRSEICAVTSCRSKSVRPHDGHDTNSVLTLRMRLPCSNPNDAVRRKSTSKGASTRTPSPSPSTSNDPPSMPIRRMKRSFRSGPLFGALAVWASYPNRTMTGNGASFALRMWKTRRAACVLESSAETSTTHSAAPDLAAAARSASDSVPTRRSAVARAPGTGLASPASTSAMAPSNGVSRSASAFTTTPTPAVIRRLTVRSFAGSVGTPSCNTIESDVAMSLKGMPTAVFAPNLE